MNVGDVKTFTISSTETVPAGTVVPFVDTLGVVAVAMDPGANTGKITAVGVGSAGISFSSPHFDPVVISKSVNPKPKLIYTEDA